MPIIDFLLRHVALLDLAFELLAVAVYRGKVAVSELAHFSLTLPTNCFQSPSIRSQFMEHSCKLVSRLSPKGTGDLGHRAVRVRQERSAPVQERRRASSAGFGVRAIRSLGMTKSTPSVDESSVHHGDRIRRGASCIR